MSCRHPDPRLVPWLFCRTCGYFENGVRVSDGDDETLMVIVKKHQGEPVHIENYLKTVRDPS